MTGSESPIRIGCYIFFPSGGIGRYTHHLLGEMAAMPEVDAEAAVTPDFEWRETDKYRTWPGLMQLSHSAPIIRRFRFLKGQFVNPIRFLKHAKKTGLNALHFANVNHISYLFWRDRLKATEIPFGISVHDVKRQRAILSRRWEDKYLKLIYRDANALFVHSEFQKKELIEFADVGSERIHIVPHGVYEHGVADITKEAARKELSLPTNREICLFFGQLRDEKNLARFIDAFSKASPDGFLVVAGKSGGRHHGVEYYRKIGSRSSMENRILFIDRYITDEDVGKLFLASDWAALPYLNSFTSQSGVLNTAIFYDRPVLVSSSPVLAETVKNCDVGVVCDGDTVEALLRGTEKMNLRYKAKDEFEFAEYRRRYSWAENARITMGVYQKLLL